MRKALTIVRLLSLTPARGSRRRPATLPSAGPGFVASQAKLKAVLPPSGGGKLWQRQFTGRDRFFERLAWNSLGRGKLWGSPKTHASRKATTYISPVFRRKSRYSRHTARLRAVFTATRPKLDLGVLGAACLRQSDQCNGGQALTTARPHTCARDPVLQLFQGHRAVGRHVEKRAVPEGAKATPRKIT